MRAGGGIFGSQGEDAAEKLLDGIYSTPKESPTWVTNKGQEDISPSFLSYSIAILVALFDPNAGAVPQAVRKSAYWQNRNWKETIFDPPPPPNKISLDVHQAIISNERAQAKEIHEALVQELEKMRSELTEARGKVASLEKEIGERLVKELPMCSKGEDE